MASRTTETAATPLDTARARPRFRNAWLIANPTAGGVYGRRQLDEAIALLRARLPLEQIRWTAKRGDAENWAREAVQQEIDLVVASGGDGTVNEVANGLARSPVVLGILPSGTVNVVAIELDIPLHAVQAAEALLSGKIERLHLGHAEFAALPAPDAASGAGAPIGRHFFFAAGFGFDAYVCFRVNMGLKRLTRKGAYIVKGLQHFVRYRAPRLHVSLDGAPERLCSLAVFANTRAYAGRFWLAPAGSLVKPELDACLFLRPGRWNLLRYALGIMCGRHTKMPDVQCLGMQEARVRSEQPVYLQIDGDPLGTTPARLRIERDALSVLTPQHWPGAAPK